MTTRADWLALAARAEAAQGPDRALDEDVEAALGWPNAAWTGLARAFSASLDAVLAVVPEGWAWCVHDVGIASVLRAPMVIKAPAPTPALAFLAAACRAQAEEAGDG